MVDLRVQKLILEELEGIPTPLGELREKFSQKYGIEKDAFLRNLNHLLVYSKEVVMSQYRKGIPYGVLYKAGEEPWTK